jgi:hypothetical protein
MGDLDGAIHPFYGSGVARFFQYRRAATNEKA